MSIRHRSPDAGWLRELSLFQGCRDRELERVQQLTSIFDVAAGKVLCHQGQIGLEIFFVISGEAEVAIDEVRIASLGPGSFFGEMAPLDGSRRVASVTAVTPMKVLVSTNQEFEMLLTDVPRVARRMLATVTGRLRLADRVLVTQQPPVGVNAPFPAAGASTTPRPTGGSTDPRCTTYQ